ncbi:hypothetical protein DRH29_03825 [candidate division Kazan bacterium]|uniref:Uncharacterized protein n=1 Tax=candidate division Kazan bacterium TaxID=2202143 RepID=A0A420ZC18_UNCK3|nr:MAG: hypothetical protein DRH29_03825 [candidate division Kazan bacterium]
MAEKKKLEKAAFDYFIKSYNLFNGTNFQFNKHSDKPDFIAEDDGQMLGVEVTHLFYDDNEAKILLGRADKRISGIMKADELIKTLNIKLADKVEQAAKYDFKNRMILVIRVASPVFDKSDFDREENSIKVPQSVFSEIWMLFYDTNTQSWSDLKQLK